MNVSVTKRSQTESDEVMRYKMNEIRISEKISYIECSEDPLSADIGIIRDNGITWLYDVGNGEKNLPVLTGRCNIVLSHFHQDHTGNLDRIPCGELFVSRETFRHTHRGTIVSENVSHGGLTIFPLPSSHAKGCLGLEVDHTYAFVGDALYCKVADDCRIYNTQLLHDEIAVLKSLQVPFLLSSHLKGLIRKTDDVIRELEAIYSQRTRNDPEIRLPFSDNEQ